MQITGNETVPYLPSCYLGDALLRQGDCPGALTAFERARNTPAAGNRAWLARMDQARETCGDDAGAARSSSGRGPGGRTSRVRRSAKPRPCASG